MFFARVVAPFSWRGQHFTSAVLVLAETCHSRRRRGATARSEKTASSNMAEKENVNTRPSVCESLVNRWLIEYYFTLSVELFQKHKHEDFEKVVDLIYCK